MISDVLSEALEAVKEYKRDMPNCYEGCKTVEIVEAVMRAALMVLDTDGVADLVDGQDGKASLWSERVRAMKKSLEALDILPLVKAMNELEHYVRQTRKFGEQN